MLFRPDEAVFSFHISAICTIQLQQKSKRQQAKFMLYSLHIASDSLAQKLGCGLLARRGTVEFSLLPYLVETKKILRLPSASLSDLLAKQNVRLARNTTVSCKLRRLLSVSEVKDACSDAVIQEILATLDLRDEKRKKESKEEEKDESEELCSCFDLFATIN